MDAVPSLPSSHPDALHQLLSLDRLASAGVDLDGLALTDGSETLTWAEFHGAVARLSGAVTAIGVVKGDRVAVHLRKSVWSFVAVHAVLRAGAIMVPLDPLAPPTAARSVLAEAEAALLITDAGQRALSELLAGRPVEHVIRRGRAADPVDGERIVTWEDALALEPGPPVSVEPDAPAYIIFTSGSTGRPKGIVHTQASALAYAERAVTTYGIGPADVLANIASLHFDQSTFELYAGPLAGATVLVVPDAVLRFPASATELIERAGATVIYTVPYVLRQFVERGALDERDLSTVRWIKYGGEVYPPADVASLMAAVPSARVSNVYGPAEVNQCTHLHLDEPPTAAVPIGRPWAGVDVRLCTDAGDDDVAPGEPGELWVASPTMMSGYWRRPDLTARSIVERDGRSWYRTGDVVRWSDGVLDFLGRDDHQVKVRGQRVELEAVEAAIAAVPGVAEVGVVPIAGAGVHAGVELAAAVVADRSHSAGFDVGDLRAALAQRLGAVAVPTEIVEVDEIARTSNGKVDRVAMREALLNGAVGVPPAARPTDEEPPRPSA